jgi:hypothetical protein
MILHQHWAQYLEKASWSVFFFVSFFSLASFLSRASLHLICWIHIHGYPQENTNAWISISGLLTSIASLHDPNNSKPRSPPLEHYIPTDLLHDRFYAIPDRARNVDRYIQVRESDL